MADNLCAVGKILADSATGTTFTATQIGRDTRHTLVTSITATFDAAVTANDANFAQLTVYKNTLNSGGTSTTQVQMGTMTTQTTGASGALGVGSAYALVPVSFTLSTGAGALNLLESDVITVAQVKSGAGVQLPANVVRVAMRVI
jgi:hypothetical protein